MTTYENAAPPEGWRPEPRPCVLNVRTAPAPAALPLAAQELPAVGVE